MWIIEKIVYIHADNTYKYMKGKRAEQSSVYSSRAVVLPFAFPHPQMSLMLQIAFFSEIFQSVQDSLTSIDYSIINYYYYYAIQRTSLEMVRSCSI